MARRLIFVAMAAALVAVWPANAFSATAPTDAPVLTSAPYASPFTIHWTPANDPLNLSQSVYRAPGACTTPIVNAGLIVTFAGNATTDYTGRPVDGTYCYFIRVADLVSTADSPGVTVSVDTTNPTATVSVSPQGAGGSLSGTVTVAGSSTDAVSGVATSVLHVGAVGACPAGAVVGAAWDTTTVSNGSYDVCNVVTDKAGHTAAATVTVTVANVLAPAALQPPVGVSPLPPTTVIADPIGLRAPTRLTVALPRRKTQSSLVTLTLHWLNPASPDLARVVLVLNRKHAPKSPADGTRVYRGLAKSAKAKLRAGQTGYFALYAYDHAGNRSAKAARATIRLAALIPLRPLTGAVVATQSPLLMWKAKKGSAYYNVQLFFHGRRVLTDWPSKASYRIPAGTLAPGTYVWYVWPALKRHGATPAFSDLIGRATFVYKG